MVEVSIIMPTMDRQFVFEQSLTALLEAISDLPFITEVIIVNDSKTTTPQLSPEVLQKVQLINNPGQGVASARNFGAKAAKGTNLLFIDDDMLVKKDNLLRTYKFLLEHPDHCYAANWIYPSGLTDRLKPSSFGRYLIKNRFVSLEGWENSPSWNSTTPYECQAVAATYLPLTKKSFENIGGFDETFPFAGFEDYDMSVRLRKSGIRLFIDPLNLILHNEADRIDLKRWMIRKRRSAQTRRVGVERGYKETAVNQSRFKYFIYYCNRPFYGFWIALTTLIPNRTPFDPIYFKLVNFILGLNIHIGYFHAKKKSGYI